MITVEDVDAKAWILPTGHNSPTRRLIMVRLLLQLLVAACLVHAARLAVTYGTYMYSTPKFTMISSPPIRTPFCALESVHGLSQA